jgi:uncharacterized membrane protein
MIILIAVVSSALTALDLDHQTWGQQSNDISQIQESLDNISSQTGEEVDHLKMIGEGFAELKQGQIVTFYLFVIAFLMGLAFVIFGLYIGQEQRLSLFTKRLYLMAYFALVIPVTVILLWYITNSILSAESNNPVLMVAFILLIPVLTSYVLMIVKYRHEVGRISHNNPG